MQHVLWEILQKKSQRSHKLAVVNGLVSDGFVVVDAKRVEHGRE
jgi:hypothetical protein